MKSSKENQLLQSLHEGWNGPFVYPLDTVAMTQPKVWTCPHCKTQYKLEKLKGAPLVLTLFTADRLLSNCCVIEITKESKM